MTNIAGERLVSLAERALKACRAWHYAEHHGLGTFDQRGSLCTYSEHLTQVALNEAGILNYDQEYQGPPRMIVWPAVYIDRDDAETVEAWVDQLIEHERTALASLPADRGEKGL